MIEISLAVAAADRAYKLLKVGIERKKELEGLGFDIEDMAKPISSFFSAKNDLDVAAAKAKNPSAANKLFNQGSVEAYAFEVVRAEKKEKELEEKVKELFWRERGGQALYSKMLRIRQVERARRLQVAREAAKKQKFMNDLIFAGIAISLALGILGYLLNLIFKSIR